MSTIPSEYLSIVKATVGSVGATFDSRRGAGRSSMPITLDDAALLLVVPEQLVELGGRIDAALALHERGEWRDDEGRPGGEWCSTCRGGGGWPCATFTALSSRIGSGS